MPNTTFDVSSTGGSNRYHPFVPSPASGSNGAMSDTTVIKTANPIRPLQQGLRDRQPDGLGGLEVDHELELRRLLHGEIGGLRSPEDLVHKMGCAAIIVREIHAVANRAARLREYPVPSRGEPLLRREIRNRSYVGVE